MFESMNRRVCRVAYVAVSEEVNPERLLGMFEQVRDVCR